MISHVHGKIAAVCLGVAALTAVAGCNGGGSSAGSAPTTSASSAAPASSAPPASSSPAPPASAPAAPPPASAPAGGSGDSGDSSQVIYNCEQQPVTQPASFILACGDGTASLKGLTWTGWGTQGATGTGQYLENSCTPNCASGGQKSYQATVEVTGLENGSYHDMTITVQNHSPKYLEYSLGQSGPTPQSS